MYQAYLKVCGENTKRNKKRSSRTKTETDREKVQNKKVEKSRKRC